MSIPEDREPPTDDLRDLASVLRTEIAEVQTRIAAARQALDAVSAGPGDHASPSGAATSRAATELAAAEQAIVRLDGIARATIEAHNKTEADADAHIEALWDRVVEASGTGDDPLGPIDPAFAGKCYPRIAMAATAIDAFVAPFGIAGETLEKSVQAVRPIGRWPTWSTTRQVRRGAGREDRCRYGGDLRHRIERRNRDRRQSKTPAIFPDHHTLH